MSRRLTSKPGGSFSILLVGTQMATGGAQKALLDQASWFHARGHRVSVAFLYDRDGLSAQWQESYPFMIDDLGAFRPGSGLLHQAFFILRGWKRLWQLMRHGHFDVIETFTVDCNLFTLPLAWLAGIPVRIATHHGWTSKDTALKRAAHRLLLQFGVADTLVTVTEGLRQEAIQAGLKPARIATIPNGVQLLPAGEDKAAPRDLLNIPAGHAFLLAVGRLVHEKAYHVLIDALQVAVREHPELVLVIAGEGPLQDQLQALIDSLGLDDKIHLLGNRQDIRLLMSGADVFVMSSRSEGMPLALLEAMSHGLPAVVPHVGGLGEVVRDRLEGLVVPPGNAPELAKAILELLRDPALRTTLGQNARRRIEERYTTAQMCQEYETLFQDLYRRKKAV